MADEQIVTNIVAKADLSSLVSEVHRVTVSLQQLQRELIASNKSIAASTKVANNAFKDTLVQSGLFSSHFVNLNSDVSKFGKNLDGGRLKLKDYFSTFQTHLKTSKGMIRELAKEQVMLENAILQPLGRNAQGLMQYNVHIPRGLDLVKNKSQLARMELQIFNRALSEGATSLINWGKNTQWAGRQLTVGLTVPLTMFGAAAGKAFKEADQELTRLVKVYGDIAGTSSQELGKIRKDVTATAKELSSAMGVSFKETLALAADVAATGKTGQDLIASVKETTRLAVLGEVDRQEAMKATLAIQTAFKSNTEELTESINFLNAVENQTSTTLNDLVEAIPKAGTVVKQLGGSVEDLALYITAMREGGVNASEAANALKSGLASMINPTKQTIGVMSEFGIDIMGMVSKNVGDTTGMITDLQASLDTLDPLSKARALEQMFGKFQFARMAALFNNLGKAGSQTLQVMDLMNASASELATVAGRELALVTESASGRFKRAVESLKASLTGVGEQFLNFGTRILNIFEKIVNFFSNLPGPIQKLLTLFGGLTAIAGPLIMITGVLANFFGYITKGIVLMRSFFQGTKGWKMLTPEMIAAERAARMVEQSFYSDAAAANVLHGALQKLISDYSGLRTAMATGAVPVNPAVSTVAGSMFMPGIRREVDPKSAYAGALDTRAMSHINPRDPNNPASLMGVVPGAIPVNRNIGKTPQIYMGERLPDIEGLTSVKGISTGIVSEEAARFHALMGTLGMQTRQEVESLKKTIGLGGTVSKDLLDTFDDILPITTRIANGAAAQSAAIVAELRAGMITIEAAKAKIIALNAQIDLMLQRDIGLYAASKGRSIDFTKAPLMDQPVVDASGQFTLRDLYKKENNKSILEEIGRLRGIRTFGAPYSIQTTRMPKFNTGGDIEGFGPGKTVVSGSTSINYDDRLASLPLNGYVVNQSASMDPNNSWLHDIAPYTYGSGSSTMTAAVTPGELVLGPEIHKDPELYAAVEAVNQGYKLGGDIVPRIKNYGRVASNLVKARGLGARVQSETRRKVYDELIQREGVTAQDISLGRLTPYQRALMSFVEQDTSTTTGYRFAARAHGPYDVASELDIPNSGYFGQAQVSTFNSLQNTLNRILGVRNVNPILPSSAQDMFTEIISKGGGLGIRKISYNDDVFDVGMARGYLDHLDDHLFGRNGTPVPWNSKLYGSKPKKKFIDIYEKDPKLAAYLRYLLDENAVTETNRAGIIFNDAQAIMAQLKVSPKEAISMAEMSYYKAMTADPENDFKYYASRQEEIENNELISSMRGYRLGGDITQRTKNYGEVLKIGKFSSLQRIREYVQNASKVKAPIVSYPHVVPSGGKSLDVPGGIGYTINSDGKRVHVKMLPNEDAFAAEDIGAYIARRMGLISPRPKLVKAKHGLDPSGRESILAAETPFDPRLIFGANGKESKNTMDSVVRQLLVSAILGDIDMSPANAKGYLRPDIGPGGITSKASGLRRFDPNLRSVSLTARANAGLEKIGAKSAFGKSVGSLIRSYGAKRAASKARKILKDSNLEESMSKFFDGNPQYAPYKATIMQRISEAKNVDWDGIFTAHSKITPALKMGGAIKGYNRGGNVSRYRNVGGRVRRNKYSYGFPPTPEELAQRKYPTASTPASTELGYDGVTRRGPGMLGFMAAQSIGSFGGYSLGSQLTGGNMFGGMAGAMAGEMGAFALLNALRSKQEGVVKQTGLMQRAFGVLARLPGPAKLLAVVVGLGLSIKKVMDTISNHRKTVSLAFGPSADVIEKLNLKFITVNDSLKATSDRLKAIKESGGALYASFTSAGIPGITLTIKQLKELKEKVTTDLPELIQMFDQAAGSEVASKAESLKAQFVAGGMSAQEAANTIYAIIAASNKASFAIRAIASEGFRSIKDEATAASSAIKTFFNLINQGNTDQLVASLDTVINSLIAAEQKLLGMKMEQFGVVDAAEAYELTLERINSSSQSNTNLTGDQLERLKEQNPILNTILGTSETLASVFAKLRMYSMGINMDFTTLDPALAEKLSVAIMRMDNFYKTDKSKNNPFAGLVKKIEEVEKASKAADEKTFESSEKKKEDLEELIELKQKEIEAIREEANERRKALEQEQQDQDILLQIKKKQLEYNNAMAAGDMQTAAAAQLDIQRLVGQQQTEFAKRAIDEKEKADIDAKESEIESLRNQIKNINEQLENAQQTAKKGAEDLAKLQDLLGRSIQAMMMGQGGYESWEIGTIQNLIKDLQDSKDPVLKSIIPALEAQLKDPPVTAFDKLLQTTLEKLGLSTDKLQAVLDKTNIPQIKVDDRSFIEKFKDSLSKFFANVALSGGFGFADGGYIRGPGTGTSDSIPGYITGYSGGGAVPIRVSNTEYITRSSSVSDIGIPNMDLINQRGADGVLMAAQNILGINAATGGYVNGLVNYAYAKGSTGGLQNTKPAQFNFNKLEDRTVYSMKHLVGKGMTPYAAAGIVGNLIAESTLRVGAEEVGHTQEGRGIAQWGVNARWKTYQNWLKRNNRKNMYDLANQLDFIWWEMHNGQLSNPEKFKSLTDISKAAYIFMDQYERPGVLRWKERNTHAYLAYKQYSGKDYVDVASTLYPSSDKAKSDYAAGLNKPNLTDQIKDEDQVMKTLKVPGISKLSALGFKSGGYLNFDKGGAPHDAAKQYKKDGKYDRLQDYFSKLGDLSVNFKTDKHDLPASEIAELKHIARQVKSSGAKSMLVKGYADKRGSTKYNMALSKRRANYVADLLNYLAPGINFIPSAVGEEASGSGLLAMSKKRRVSIELPPRGYNLGLPEEPRNIMGSTPLEGVFGGVGFAGLLTLAKGGYLGFDKGGSFDLHDIVRPYAGGISQKDLAKKHKNLSYDNPLIDNFTSKYSSGFSKMFANSPAGAILPASHIAFDVLGTWLGGRKPTFGKRGFAKDLNPNTYAPILETLVQGMLHPYSEIAKGSATKGDWINSILGIIPFGTSLGVANKAKIANTAFKNKMVPPSIRVKMTSAEELENRFKALKSKYSKNETSDMYRDQELNQARYEAALKKALVAKKTKKVIPFMDLPKVTFDDLLKENKALQNFEEVIQTGKEPGRYKFKFKKGTITTDDQFNIEHWLEQIKKDPSYAYESLAGANHKVSVIDTQKQFTNGVGEVEIAYIEYDPITGAPHFRTTHPDYEGQGWSKYLWNKAESFTRIKHSSNLTPQGRASAIHIGGFASNDPIYQNLDTLADITKVSSRVKDYIKALTGKKKKKIVIRKEDLPASASRPGSVYQDPHDGVGFQLDRMLERAQYAHLTNIRPEVREWFANPYRRTSNFPYMNGSGVEIEFQDELLRLAGLEKEARRPLAADGFPKLAGGGYMGELRKFHDWNGIIPGNYGQEVGAVLQAGKESVYDTDYINALKNGTMNSTTSNSKVINVGSVKMEFTEPVTNGRQIFEEFKSLINFENSKAGPSINIGRGA